MTKIDYVNEIAKDVEEYKLPEFFRRANDGEFPDVECFTEGLVDSCWTDDAITGNASGSYYCNSAMAARALVGASDLLQEMAREFCIDGETALEHLGDPEYWDVCIRCYLLSEAVDVAMKWNSETIEGLFE